MLASLRFNAMRLGAFPAQTQAQAALQQRGFGAAAAGRKAKPVAQANKKKSALA